MVSARTQVLNSLAPIWSHLESCCSVLCTQIDCTIPTTRRTESSWKFGLGPVRHSSHLQSGFEFLYMLAWAWWVAVKREYQIIQWDYVSLDGPGWVLSTSKFSPRLNPWTCLFRVPSTPPLVDVTHSNMCQTCLGFELRISSLHLLHSQYACGFPSSVLAHYRDIKFSPSFKHSIILSSIHE